MCRVSRRCLALYFAASALFGCYLNDELPPGRRDDPNDTGDDAGLHGRALPPPPSCGPDRQPKGSPKLARNILFFLGDGMGVEHIAAGRALAGGTLRMDELAMVTVLNTDSTTTDADPFLPPTDSAAGATAFATGTRVANSRLALDDAGNALESVLDIAQQEGKAVGLVTTSFLFDASPMAFAIHVATRTAFQDIVDQLMARPPVDVLMGGASGLLDDVFIPWRELAVSRGYRIVTTAEELTSVPVADERYVLGLYTPHLISDLPPGGFTTTPVLERTGAATDPDLVQMTERALAVLERDADGFFLLVENEHIDAYSHIGTTTPQSKAGVPNEVVALDRAVGVGLDWVAAHGGFDETLVLVSADHETGDYRHNPDDPLHGAFATSAHTRTGVAAYAEGPGTDRLAMLCRTSDLFALLTGRPY